MASHGFSQQRMSSRFLNSLRSSRRCSPRCPPRGVCLLELSPHCHPLVRGTSSHPGIPSPFVPHTALFTQHVLDSQILPFLQALAQMPLPLDGFACTPRKVTFSCLLLHVFFYKPMCSLRTSVCPPAEEVRGLLVEFFFPFYCIKIQTRIFL